MSKFVRVAEPRMHLNHATSKMLPGDVSVLHRCGLLVFRMCFANFQNKTDTGSRPAWLKHRFETLKL